MMFFGSQIYNLFEYYSNIRMLFSTAEFESFAIILGNMLIVQVYLYNQLSSFSTEGLDKVETMEGRTSM